MPSSTAGAPVDLTQDQVDELVGGRTSDEVVSLLEAAASVQPEEPLPISSEKPVPLSTDQIESIISETVDHEQIAVLLEAALAEAASRGGFEPPPSDAQSPIELTPEELAELAEGVAPKAIASRLPERIEEATAAPEITGSMPSGVAVNGLTTPPPFPGRLLRFPPLTVGEDVRMWQLRMIERGFDIEADAKYGLLSKKACIALQVEKGLDDDGIVGPLTWEATFSEG